MEERRADEALFPTRPKYGHRIIRTILPCKQKNCPNFSSRECHDCEKHCSENKK